MTDGESNTISQQVWSKWLRTVLTGQVQELDISADHVCMLDEQHEPKHTKNHRNDVWKRNNLVAEYEDV